MKRFGNLTVFSAQQFCFCYSYYVPTQAFQEDHPQDAKPAENKPHDQEAKPAKEASS